MNSADLIWKRGYWSRNGIYQIRSYNKRHDQEMRKIGSKRFGREFRSTQYDKEMT